jgi:hypothetical protein
MSEEQTEPPDEEAAPESFNSPHPLAVFVRDAVEGYFVTQGLAYELESDGDLVCTLRDRPAGRTLRVEVQLPLDQELGPVLQVECWAGLELDDSQVAAAGAVCSDWNRDEWWPKAYVDQPSEGQPSTMVLEYTLPLGRSLSQLQVEEFLAAFNVGAVNFWKRIDEDHPELLAPPPI